MRCRLLGNSGLRVSEAVSGTMTFDEDRGWGAGKGEGRMVYDAFRDVGGNFINAADLTRAGDDVRQLKYSQYHRPIVPS